jgi:outer membrane protein TolC
MNRRHILLLGVLVLTMGLTLAAQASARPLTKSPVVTGTPDLVARWMQRQTPTAPDLIERYVQRQPAASYYTAAALNAQGLRMQAMAKRYTQQNASVSSTSRGFDVQDGLLGAAGGVGIAVAAAGLLLGVSRSRRPHVVAL